MTDNNKLPERYVVTQADRDAAAPLIVVDGDVGTRQYRYDLRRGLHDSHTLVQAFAKHRLSASPSSGAAIPACELCGVPEGRHEHDCPSSTWYDDDKPTTPAEGQREAVARLLCEQHGGDPDATAFDEHDNWDGPLWTVFLKEADAILALTPPASDDRLRKALEPFIAEINRLERDYGFNRPAHQGQCLVLPLSDLIALRTALEGSTSGSKGE